MIRTRYCSSQNFDQFKVDLESKGHEIIEVTTMAGVTQVKYRVHEVANSVFEESLHQLRNGNTSDDE